MPEGSWHNLPAPARAFFAMALTAGSRIGAYEIQSTLGAGGMGVVYRARDTRLNRDVALKVLPDVFAQDPDRLERFKREAQFLAALNHPHVGAIHGLEDSGASPALVLELVEGPTLAERIAEHAGDDARSAGLAAPGVPLQEALAIARQIADALAAAHELGIVHRDLKPANIKVRDDGTVKVLDFGLAKAMLAGDGSGGGQAALSMSPTMTSPAMVTGAGVILGTAAYMAPEQARGKTVDKRADIWAFGCVLYEMLTGRRAFEGEDVSDTLAAILRGEPDWAALPDGVPAPIRALLVRCLEKDRARRVADISTARFVLDEIPRLTSAAATGPSPQEVQATVADAVGKAVAAERLDALHTAQGARRTMMRAGAAVAVVAAVVAGAAAWFAARGWTASGTLGTPAAVTRSLLAVNPFDMRPPAAPEERRPPLPRPDRTAFALSPDARTLVFRGASGPTLAEARLYRRSLDSLEATPIDGTDGADGVFLSPDAAWIGFTASGEIRKVPMSGGPASTIARIPGTGQRLFGASWGRGDADGVIVFSTLEGLWRVPASGGAPVVLVKPGPTEYQYVLPHLLPQGDAVIYTIEKELFQWDTAQVVVRSLATGAQKVLMDDAADARYMASSGHLLFVRRGTLMAAPFDAARLELTGGAVAVLDGMMQAVGNINTTSDSGAAQYATAPSGTLVYADGGPSPTRLTALASVTRTGLAERLSIPGAAYLAPRLAPSGDRVAVTEVTPQQRVWLYHVDRRTRTLLTAGTEQGVLGVWAPDGQTIGMSSPSGGAINLYRKAADGTGAMDRLTTSPNFQTPSDWSPDGKAIAFVERDAATGWDIWLLDVDDPKRVARPWLKTPASEGYPTFSPDGRWLAYASNESGRAEVYVQPYPGPGPRVLVSTEGGDAPAWRGDGAELFYLTLPTQSSPRSMMAVPVQSTATGLAAGAPRRLFDASAFGFVIGTRGYDVTRDGQRFLMVQTLEPPPQTPTNLVLVSNWLDELRRRVPMR